MYLPICTYTLLYQYEQLAQCHFHVMHNNKEYLANMNAVQMYNVGIHSLVCDCICFSSGMRGTYGGGTCVIHGPRASCCIMFQLVTWMLWAPHFTISGIYFIWIIDRCEISFLYFVATRRSIKQLFSAISLVTTSSSSYPITPTLVPKNTLMHRKNTRQTDF